MNTLRWLGEFVGSAVLHSVVVAAVFVWLTPTRSAIVAAVSVLFVTSLGRFAFVSGGSRAAFTSGAFAAWLLLLFIAALVGWAVEHPYSQASTAEALWQATLGGPRWSNQGVAESAALVVGPCLAALALVLAFARVRLGERRVA